MEQLTQDFDDAIDRAARIVKSIILDIAYHKGQEDAESALEEFFEIRISFDNGLLWDSILNIVRNFIIQTIARQFTPEHGSESDTEEDRRHAFASQVKNNVSAMDNISSLFASADLASITL